MKISETIKKNILDAAKSAGFSAGDFTIEHPADLTHGDYATNIAMVTAKQAGSNPREIAEKICAELNKNLPQEIESVSVAGPGFINLSLKKDFFANSLAEILKEKENFGKNNRLKGQSTLIEYTDPNPFKQFHIGHLMSNSIGEAVSRIAVWNGAKVARVCYQGDAGLHVAKALWAISQNSENFPSEDAPLSDRTKFLGDAYVLGSQKEEADPAAKKEIEEINQKVYGYLLRGEKMGGDLERFYDLGKKWSLEHFEEIYKKLNTKFDYYIFESQVSDASMKIVKSNIGNVFTESQGAIVYEGEQDGLHTRVFINRLGLPTYDAKELGLAFRKEKLKFWGNFEKSVVVTASEQQEYFKVVMAALKKIKPEIAKKTQHVTHGMMQFADGKMSSRKGNVITGESLIDEVEEKVAAKIADQDFADTEKEKIKTAVAIAAIKYSILKQTPGKNIIFDPEKSLSFEGDSGPYLQYTYTRANSVLEKAAEQKKQSTAQIPADWQTTNLEKMLYRFPEVVATAFDETGPQYLVTFATQIASEFNSFYGQNKVLDGGGAEAYKLVLVQAVAVVLGNCLEILGMKVLERM